MTVPHPEDSARTVEAEIHLMEQGQMNHDDEEIPVAPIITLASTADGGAGNQSGSPTPTATAWRTDDSVVVIPIDEDEMEYNDDGTPCVVATELPTSATSSVPTSGTSHQLQNSERSFLVGAMVWKAHHEQSVGIGLKRTEGRVCVSLIKPTGLFGQSPLRVGDKILSVNNTSCKGMQTQEVIRLVKEARESLNICVENTEGKPNLVATMVSKPYPTARLGISVKATQAKLKISRINKDGLFANSLLNVGDTCISINGFSCAGMNSAGAVHILKNSPEHATIVAETEHETGAVLATFLTSSHEVLPVSAPDMNDTEDTDSSVSTTPASREGVSAVRCLFAIVVTVLVVVIKYGVSE